MGLEPSPRYSIELPYRCRTHVLTMEERLELQDRLQANRVTDALLWVKLGQRVHPQQIVDQALALILDDSLPLALED